MKESEHFRIFNSFGAGWIRTCRKIYILFSEPIFTKLVLIFTKFSQSNNMSNLYEVRNISGKGFGCFATQNIKRGTMIVAETPQMVLDKNLLDEKEQIVFNPMTVDNILSSFNSMKKSDQEEFWKLSDKYGHESIVCLPMSKKTELRNVYVNRKNLLLQNNSKALSRKALKIFNVYVTNCFSDGLFIKISRFNHSCRPNAFIRKGVNFFITAKSVVTLSRPVLLDRGM